MPLRYAINGLGRVGRALLRITRDRPELELAAINDVAALPVLARLVARDTVHGPFRGTVAAAAEALRIDGRDVPVSHQPEPARIDWRRVGVAVVVEATGRFTGRSLAAAHLAAGARSVIISANADPDDPADLTVCQGVNEHDYDPRRHSVVSNASCTTNCLALVARVLHQRFGLRGALASTVHSYTENQRLLDLAHPEPRRARAAALNIIPTSTTAPQAVGLVCPELAGRIEGFSARVPTPAVALLDLVTVLDRPVTAESVRQAFRDAAEGPLAGLLGVTDEELVSSDFIGDPRSAVVDLALVQTVGEMARVVAWYDNEWGYASRLADLLSRQATLCLAT